MVARLKSNPTDFDRKAAAEANRHIFAVLGRFELSQAVQAARDYAAEHPGCPSFSDYGKVLAGIRSQLTGEGGDAKRAEEARRRLEERVREASETYEGSAGWVYPGDDVVRKCIIEGRTLPLQKHRLTVDYPAIRAALARKSKDGLGLGDLTERDQEEGGLL